MCSRLRSKTDTVLGTKEDLGVYCTRLVDRLIKRQQEDGRWIDFTMHGASDQWVTGYCALALAEYNRSAIDAGVRVKDSILRAYEYLQAVMHPCGGWGYNANTQPDSDSSAIILRFMVCGGFEVPQKSVGFLRQHGSPAQGYKTYLRDNPKDRWGKPAPEITAAVSNILYDTGSLSEQDLSAIWTKHLSWRQRKSGDWSGFWWCNNAYPTLSVYELLHRLKISPERETQTPHNAGQFDLACLLHSACLLGHDVLAGDILHRLLLSLDGEALCVRPSAYLQAPAAFSSHLHGDRYALDGHGLFTLAQIIRSFTAAIGSGVSKGPAFSGPQKNREVQRASPIKNRLESTFSSAHIAVIEAITGTTGLMPIDPLRSVLSGGAPIEFSARLEAAESSFRCACEYGVKDVDSVARYHSEVNEMSSITARLGLEDSWARLRPFVQSLTDNVPYVADPRFLTWVGLDIDPKDSQDFTVKLYMNAALLKVKNGGDQTKALLASLADFGLCRDVLSPPVTALLETEGFLQEFGFALRPDGEIGMKLYWEFDGYQEHVLRKICQHFGFDPSTIKLTPFQKTMPALISYQEACHLPFGISLRIHPVHGFLPEITTAFKFPVRTQNAENFLMRFKQYCTDHAIHSCFDKALWCDLTPKPSLITVTHSYTRNFQTLYFADSKLCC